MLCNSDKAGSPADINIYIYVYIEGGREGEGERERETQAGRQAGRQTESMSTAFARQILVPARVAPVLRTCRCQVGKGSAHKQVWAAPFGSRAPEST